VVVTAAELRREVGLPLAAWATVAAALLTLQRLVTPAAAGGPLSGRFYGGWNHFDGPEYLHIAAQGYQQRQLVWFPLYPMLIRAVHAVTGDPVRSGVAVSLVAGAALAVLLWRWLGAPERGLSPGARAVAFAAVLLYPYAWFLYGVIYADALYLALVVGAFVALERDRTALAVAVAVAATATRPSGWALPLGMAVLHLERRGALAVPDRAEGWAAALRLPLRLDRARLRARDLAPLAGLAGLAGYMAWQWASWGSPLRFVTEQENYHEPGTAALLKHQYFAAFSGHNDARYLATTTFQFLIVVLVLFSVPFVGRRFGWGYGVFVLATATFPAVSVSTFMGCGRYLLEAFPTLVLVGEALHRRRPAVRVAWFAACVALLAVMSFGYARSWYLT
jgi:hypothetical protein